jgi:short-subunit dehydrogenase
MKRILIIGATSAIAQETAKLFAAKGDQLFLVARNEEKLKVVTSDLAVRGATKVGYMVLDLNEFDKHLSMVDKAIQFLSGLDIILIAHGTLSEQKACEQSYKLAEQELKTNLLSVISLLTHIANQFERQKYGCIAVISSVAGDRGRQSNYLYGTAKGAVSFFLQGLRSRLYKSGVSVITIKPGLIDTSMTASLKKGLLFVGPDIVAKAVYQAIQNKKDVIYVPFYWRGIMAIIKLIPESIFKKLKL